MPGTRLQLERAAGCAQKDISYWGGAVIQIYDELSRSVSLTGDMVASASGKPPLTAKQFEHKLSSNATLRGTSTTPGNRQLWRRPTTAAMRCPTSPAKSCKARASQLKRA